MAATPLSYTYCTQADVERILSAAGVRDRLDDDEDQLVSSTEHEAWTDILAGATDTVNFYCWSMYSPENLATSNFITNITAKLAAYHLCTRRGNPAPESIQEQAQKAEEMLQRVYENSHPLPNVPLRRALAPAWSSIYCDPRYNHRVIRVERNASTQDPTQQTALSQNVDYRDAYSFEI